MTDHPRKTEYSFPARQTPKKRNLVREIQRWAPWIAAAAIAVVLAVVVLFVMRARDGSSAVQTVLVRQDAIDEDAVFRRYSDPLRLAFEADLPANAFPIEIVVSAVEGEAVFRESVHTPRSLAAGRYVHFDCYRKVCGPGIYRARITVADASRSPVEWVFEVVD